MLNVNSGKFRLSSDYEHFISAYVKLERLEDTKPRLTSICGLKLYANKNIKFQKGVNCNEIAINDQIVRIYLITNSLNLKVASDITSTFPKRIHIYNNIISSNKSILKQSKKNEFNTASKTVSFSNTYYITPIPPRDREKSPSPMKDFEFEYSSMASPHLINHEYITYNTSMDSTTPPLINVVNEELEEYTDIEYLEEPIRRGRPPKDSVSTSSVYRPPKKRGWPLGLSRKTYKSTITAKKNETNKTTIKTKKSTGRRGRPRKKVAFGFNSVMSAIRTVTLPSELWSAHITVTAKMNHVWFMRLAKTVSKPVSVKCDRTVKFNESMNYLVKINNRNVDLIAAPSTVNSVRDIEILLDIVHGINANDPFLDYNNG